MTTENTPTTPVVPAETPVVPVEPSKVETPVTPPPAPKYLTLEEARQLLAEAKESGRREMQSEKDKDVRDAIREANRLKQELANVNAGFGELDEDARTKMELARYRASDRTRQQFEAEEAQRRAVEQTVTQFKADLTEHATDLGINPTDTRLDWGVEGESLTIRNKKFLASVRKIEKEQKRASEESFTNKFKETEMKLRKELGLDSVEGAPPVTPKPNTISQALDDYNEGRITSEEARKRGVKFQ